MQRAELIREQTRLPELEYGFAQAMFRDVAYESLLLRDRRMYHRLVAQQLEEAHTAHRSARKSTNCWRTTTACRTITLRP